jgi:small basic protein (TIGR04137 family)
MTAMSIDNSLKSGSGLAKHRNVLNRTERIAKLTSQGKFDMTAGDPTGLPKVGNRKLITGAKAKKAAPAAK